LSFQEGIQTLGKVPGRLLCSPNAVEPYLQEFGRRGEYTNAVDIIDVLQLRTPATAELLSQGLSVPDARTREACAVSLERFGIQALPVLPAVTQALGDADSEVRYYAARTLEKLGTNAVPAREALERATNDTNVMVQKVAGRVLKCFSAR
jgi:HEAT repeat protein